MNTKVGLTAEQMVEHARKALRCLYLATDAEVAKSVEAACEQAFTFMLRRLAPTPSAPTSGEQTFEAYLDAYTRANGDYPTAEEAWQAARAAPVVAAAPDSNDPT